MRTIWVLLALVTLTLCSTGILNAEPITVGVSSALTGDAATFGTDIKNALLFGNERLTQGRYRFIFEDDKCTGQGAVSVAHKLTAIDKVKYVLGFACNQALLSAAPIYRRANTLIITSSAETGDVYNVGDKIFRLFPAEQANAELLYDYISKRYHKIGIITEQNEFTELLSRGFFGRSSKLRATLPIHSEEFRTEDADLKPQLLRMKASGVEALYVNSNAEATFIRAVQQMAMINYHPQIFASYWPASPSVLSNLGASLEGAIFSNLPLSDDLLTDAGRAMMSDFVSQYGEPASGASVVPITLEALRIFDLSINSNKSPEAFLKNTRFTDGLIKDYQFDQYGAVTGIKFILQTVKSGKLEQIREH